MFQGFDDSKIFMLYTVEVNTIAIDLLRIGHAYTTDIGVPRNMGSGRYMQRTSCQIVKGCSVPMLYIY
jgi:hypothetical protein